jgi:diamine N-acetyltransferase
MQIVSIQYAEAADAESIAVLSRQAFSDTFAPYNTKENMEKFLKEQFYTALLIDEVRTEGNIFLLAKADEELAGYAYMRETEIPPELDDSPAIEIVRLYASQKNIGKGIGKALIDKCIQIAREMRKKLIWLCVWEHNQRAIDFYIKRGFERFGVHLFVLGDDLQNDWMMKKIL